LFNVSSSIKEAMHPGPYTIFVGSVKLKGLVKLFIKILLL
jgi:hypothetical protein